MPILGSSPLGLVMDSSNNTKVKIGQQNLSTDIGTGKQLYTSLFGQTGENGVSTNKFRFRDADDKTYDISTESIVAYCQETGHDMLYLTYADFAYLKNLGVYPNNRLIIARRFTAPVKDDLINNDNQSFPTATLISWVPDNEDFFDVSFGEKWDDADTSFKNLLNDASSNTDLLAGDNAKLGLGTYMMGAVNAIPLPGWSEGLQYSVFKALGLSDLNPADLPFGNPNLIRSAKMRAIAGKDDRFEGFTTKISVKMVIEYEQKFIAGICPTAVYYDIIANALAFGTSESKFMFRSDTLNSTDFSKFLNDLGSGNVGRFKSALSRFVDALKSALDAVGDALKKALSNLIESISSKDAGFFETTVLGIVSTIVAGVVSKYKVKVLGILNSLTGSPSAPWHVTIGNPKRPIFSSGDMLVDDVNVKFGKLLAYNDLPSSVKIELTLTNARALGAQEIFSKLSCGEDRSYKRVNLDILSADTNLPGYNKGSTSPYVEGKLVPQNTGTQSSTTNSNNQQPKAGSGTNGGTENTQNKDQSKSTDPGNPNNPGNNPPNSNAGPGTTGASPPSTNATTGTAAAAAATTGQQPAVSASTTQRAAPATKIYTAGNIRIENLQCLTDYNILIEEIVSIIELRDSYGVESGKKVPLLKKHKGTFSDNEEAAINELKIALGGVLKPRYDNLRKCSAVQNMMNASLQIIYGGIQNQKTVQVDVFEQNKVVGNNVPMKKRQIRCDF